MFRRAADIIQRSRGKRELRSPLRARRAENFQVLEIKYEKLLLVYFMRFTLRPREAISPCPPLWAAMMFVLLRIFTSPRGFLKLKLNTKLFLYISIWPAHPITRTDQHGN